MTDHLRWLIDNVPEDTIEEHALEIEQAINEHAALKRENGKLTAWQELTVGSLLFWLEGETGLDFATHAKRLLRDVCTCENEPPLCRICGALADTQEKTP